MLTFPTIVDSPIKDSYTGIKRVTAPSFTFMSSFTSGNFTPEEGSGNNPEFFVGEEVDYKSGLSWARGVIAAMIRATCEIKDFYRVGLTTIVSRNVIKKAGSRFITNPDHSFTLNSTRTLNIGDHCVFNFEGNLVYGHVKALSVNHYAYIRAKQYPSIENPSVRSTFSFPPLQVIDIPDIPIRDIVAWAPRDLCLLNERVEVLDRRHSLSIIRGYSYCASYSDSLSYKLENGFGTTIVMGIDRVRKLRAESTMLDNDADSIKRQFAELRVGPYEYIYVRLIGEEEEGEDVTVGYGPNYGNILVVPKRAISPVGSHLSSVGFQELAQTLQFNPKVRDTVEVCVRNEWKIANIEELPNSPQTSNYKLAILGTNFSSYFPLQLLRRLPFSYPNHISNDNDNNSNLSFTPPNIPMGDNALIALDMPKDHIVLASKQCDEKLQKLIAIGKDRNGDFKPWFYGPNSRITFDRMCLDDIRIRQGCEFEVTEADENLSKEYTCSFCRELLPIKETVYHGGSEEDKPCGAFFCKKCIYSTDKLNFGTQGEVAEPDENACYCTDRATCKHCIKVASCPNCRGVIAETDNRGEIRKRTRDKTKLPYAHRNDINRLKAIKGKCSVCAKELVYGDFEKHKKDGCMSKCPFPACGESIPGNTQDIIINHYKTTCVVFQQECAHDEVKLINKRCPFKGSIWQVIDHLKTCSYQSAASTISKYKKGVKRCKQELKELVGYMLAFKESELAKELGIEIGTFVTEVTDFLTILKRKREEEEEEEDVPEKAPKIEDNNNDNNVQ